MFRPIACALLLLTAFPCLGATSELPTSRIEVFSATYSDNGSGQRILIRESKGLLAWDQGRRLVEESLPRFIAEHQPVGPERLVTLRSPDPSILKAELRRRQVRAEPLQAQHLEEEADEVVALVESGDSANRIDVVFMGDGYTASERTKFFDDIRRMVDDMFRDVTFRSYLPIFNVYAVFRPSNESGIGRNNQPKNTAYRLYRAGNTLRAIYYGNPMAARNSCSQAPGCDYPTIIGNDPYYGGLGGEFAVSTSSLTSGTMVLRHEFGHTMGRVGEEYDGAGRGGYFGANFSQTTSGLEWTHWATTTPVTPEPAISRYVAYPWWNLENGVYTANFTSDGTAERAQIRFSASGMPTDDSLSVSLDGTDLGFLSAGNDDRNFYTMEFANGFSQGSHALEFRQGVADGNNWLSSLRIEEFGPGFHDDPSFYGAYPNYGSSGTVSGYRPTYQTCLMRDMKSEIFCHVCLENKWLKFMAQIRLIDDLTESSDSTNTTVTLKTLGLGQLRDDYAGPAVDGVLEVRWYRNGNEVEDLRDQFQWQRPISDATGSWRAEVEFRTPEVRHDPRGLLLDQKVLTISE